jgi:hypothetical protein
LVEEEEEDVVEEEEDVVVEEAVEGEGVGNNQFFLATISGSGNSFLKLSQTKGC